MFDVRDVFCCCFVRLVQLIVIISQSLAMSLLPGSKLLLVCLMHVIISASWQRSLILILVVSSHYDVELWMCSDQ